MNDQTQTLRQELDELYREGKKALLAVAVASAAIGLLSGLLLTKTLPR